MDIAEYPDGTGSVICVQFFESSWCVTVCPPESVKVKIAGAPSVLYQSEIAFVEPLTERGSEKFADSALLYSAINAFLPKRACS